MKKVVKKTKTKKAPLASTRRPTKRVLKKAVQARPKAVRKVPAPTPAAHAGQKVSAAETLADSGQKAPGGVPEISPEVLQAFFQKRTPYYTRRWERYRRQQFPGWNWGACIMGPWWFFYRRMPWFGVGFLLVGMIGLVPKVGLLALGVNLLLGILGNELYFSEFKHLYLRKTSSGGKVEPEFWVREGGVKHWALGAMVGAWMLVLTGLGIIALLGGNDVSTPPENVFSSNRHAVALPPRPDGAKLMDQANGDLCIQAGRIATEQGHLGKAIQSYTQALEYNPQLAVGFLKRGEVFARRGDWLQAESDFKRAVELDPALQGQVDQILRRKK